VKWRTAIGLAAVLVLTLAFAMQVQARSGSAHFPGPGHAQPRTSTSVKAAPITPVPVARPAAPAVDPAYVGNTDAAWVSYYNNPEDTSTWQAFCADQGGSGIPDYIPVANVVPAVPACSPTPVSLPEIGIPGCYYNSPQDTLSGPCTDIVTGGAQSWPITSSAQQCVELAERYLYLRYGWAGIGVGVGGGSLVQAYAAAYAPTAPGLRVIHNGSGSAPAVGDVISFSGSTINTAGHVAIVTAVDLVNGTVTFTGQNQGANNAAASTLWPMPKTPKGWSVTPWSGYKNIEWLHAQPIITFSEFPVGTAIGSQYLTDGIKFTGDNPYITTDGSNPTSPVLSGTPRFQGSITGTFFVPGTTAPQRTGVLAFSVDVGYIDNPNSVEVVYFDMKGKRLGSLLASAFGIDTLNVTSSIPIGSFTVHSVTNEPYGWAIDNVAIHF